MEDNQGNGPGVWLNVHAPGGGPGPGPGPWQPQFPTEACPVVYWDWGGDPGVTTQLHGELFDNSSVSLGWYEPGADSTTFGAFTPAANVTSGDESIVKVQKWQEPGQEETSWLLQFLSIGETTLTVTATVGQATKTGTLDVTVDLPQFGAYSAPRRTPETCLSNQIVYGDGEGEYTTVYYLVPNGFQVQDPDSVTFTPQRWDDSADGMVDDPSVVLGAEALSGGVTGWELTLADPGAESYWVRVEIDGEEYPGLNVTPFRSDPDDGFSSQGLELTIDGQTYYIAFGIEDQNDLSLMVGGCFGAWGSSWEADEGRTPCAAQPIVYVGYALAPGVWEKAPDGLVTVNVSKLTIEPVEEEGLETESFSWAQDELVLTTTDIQEDGVTGPTLWAYPARNARVYVRATLTYRIKDGEPQSGEVVMADFVEVIEDEGALRRPEDDTVEKLNAFLLELSQRETDTEKTRYEVALNPEADYTGIIRLPAKGFDLDHKQLSFFGGTVTGGMDLNGCQILDIVGINFVAPAGAADTKAIYNGDCIMANSCSFTGYDLAVESGSKGMINLRSCTFTDNTVATSIDVASLSRGTRNYWEFNDFMGNGTAVRMVSFNVSVSPYTFHIYDSNFVDNDCDFDLVPANTTVYMYRDYFGVTAEAAADAPSYTARDPRVKLGTGSKVVIDPRWRDFVVVQADPETGEPTVLDNERIADWSNPVLILNEETEGGRLDLGAAAFAGAGTKVIQVLDADEDVMGTWTFPGAKAAALAAELLAEPAEETPFNAGLTLGEAETGFTVSVVPSTLLGALTPTLTVAGGSDWENAAVTGPDGKTVDARWDNEAKTVTFPVAQGGAYTVAKADKAEEPDLDPEPTPTPTPVPVVPTPDPDPAPTTETEEHEDGSVTTTVTEPDGTVTETTTAVDGTVVETVTTPDGDLTLTVTDPEGQVAVSIELPGELPSLPEDAAFTDVPEDHWAAGAVDAMAALELVQGVDPEARVYDLTGQMSRASLATVLFRLSNGAEGLESTFADVAEGQWYTDAVAWAAKVGVVTGYTADTFRPDSGMTRQELAVMLCRFAALIGLDTQADTAALDAFTDASAIGGWAREGLAWCVRAGILQGKGAGVLDPQGAVTRAEAAVVMSRLIALIGG